jgi:hypothetical protein
MAGLRLRCLWCAEVFEATRITARYCRNSHRQMAYTARHAPPRPRFVARPLTAADLLELVWKPETPANPD